MGVLDQLRSWVWDQTSGCTEPTEELGLGPDQWVYWINTEYDWCIVWNSSDSISLNPFQGQGVHIRKQHCPHPTPGIYKRKVPDDVNSNMQTTQLTLGTCKQHSSHWAHANNTTPTGNMQTTQLPLGTCKQHSSYWAHANNTAPTGNMQTTQFPLGTCKQHSSHWVHANNTAPTGHMQTTQLPLGTCKQHSSHWEHANNTAY